MKDEPEYFLRSCPTDGQGLVCPWMTESGTIILVCDEEGQVWLDPDHVGVREPLYPSAYPDRTIDSDGVQLKLAGSRLATIEELQAWRPDVEWFIIGQVESHLDGPRHAGNPRIAVGEGVLEFGRRLRLAEEAGIATGWTDMAAIDVRNFSLDGLDDESFESVVNADMSGTTLAGCKLSNRRIVDFTWSGGSADRTTFTKTEFHRSRLSDLSFTRCDFIRTEFHSSSIERVTFTDCLFVKTLFWGGELQDVRFVDCEFDLPSFDLKLNDVFFGGASVGRLRANEPLTNSEQLSPLVSAATNERLATSSVVFDL